MQYMCQLELKKRRTKEKEGDNKEKRNKKKKEIRKKAGNERMLSHKPNAFVRKRKGNAMRARFMNIYKLEFYILFGIFISFYLYACENLKKTKIASVAQRNKGNRD